MTRDVLSLRDVVVTRGRKGAEEIVLAAVDLAVAASEVVTIGVEHDNDAELVSDVLAGRRRPIYGVIERHGAVRVVRLPAQSPTPVIPLRPDGHALVVVGGALSVNQVPADRSFTLSGGALVATVPEPRWPRADLHDAVTRLLTRHGCPESHAEVVARVLVDADRCGHPGHGVGLLPVYLERLRRGGIDAQAQPRLLADSGVVAVLSAQGGFGQVAAWEAAERCAAAAERTGLAAVAVRHTNHVGMLGAYREPFVRHGMVGLIMTISGPSVAAPGGAGATIGNNAICLVAPGDGAETFVADFATGTVACGRIRTAARRGEPVPEGWLIDRHGRSSRDPADLDDGGAVPVFGDHKGLALSMIIEVLAGVLGGGTTSDQVHRQRREPERAMDCAQLFVGFSPPAFLVEGTSDLLDGLKRAVAGGQPAGREAQFPGDRESRHARDADRRGVPVPAEVVDLLGLLSAGPYDRE